MHVTHLWPLGCRAWVLVIGTGTRSSRVLNFWYSYVIRTREFQSNKLVLELELVLVDKYSSIHAGPSIDILWYICDINVKTIIPVK